jgi:beta-N-acetylhexosaminidase
MTDAAEPDPDTPADAAAAVQAALAAVADPDRAAGVARYFQSGPGQYGAHDEFIGVTVPQIRGVVKRFPALPLRDITVLLENPVHEQRLAGLLILVAQFGRASAPRTRDETRRRELAEYYLAQVRAGRVNNWDLVDSSAPALLGDYLFDRPRGLLYELAASDILWHRRVAVIATQALIRRGDASTTLDLAARLLTDPEPLMHKAVGWMLREVGARVDRALLLGFLDEHAGRMPRTMLSYATEHLSPEQRAHYRALPRAARPRDDRRHRSEDTRLRRSIRSALMPGFVGTELPAWLADRLRNGLGAVCLFGSNISSIVQVRELTAAIRAANPDAVIAIDEEGGDVTRLHFGSGSPYPGNAILGRIDDLDLTEEVGRQVGWELRRAGCTLAFAPDADVNSNADNPVIGVRSFGADPGRVGRHVAAWVRGLQSTGVAACPKHFPGHGDTALDSHLAMPVVDLPLTTLRERELVPFGAAIDAGARTVMTSHILLPQIDAENPATLSPAVLGGLLRRDLGFDGVIVSDALDMAGASGTRGIPAAAVAALAAGCDLLCIGTANTAAQLDEIELAILEAVAAGTLPPARLADAADRVSRLAAGTSAASRAAPIPPAARAQPEPSFDTARIVASFAVNDRASQWLAAEPAGYTVVRLDTPSNIAVAGAPWGPFAETAARANPALAGAWRAGLVVARSSGDTADLQLPAASPVLVIGRDNHRHPFVRDLVDGLRAERTDVLVVDMGWPSDDLAYADIATYGASRLAGRALLELLA